MTVLSENDRIKAMLTIASLAIAAEKAALDRRWAQSDFHAAWNDSGKQPSRKKLSRLEGVEKRLQKELRSAIYAYAKAVDAAAAVEAGLTPVAEDNREYTAQLLAHHLP